MYGLYIRNKTSIAVDTDNYSIVIDNEKFEPGIVQDAGIQLKTSVWGSGVTAWTYGIDMNQTGAFGTADIRLQNGETIDNNTNGNVVINATNVGIGSTTPTGNLSIGTTQATSSIFMGKLCFYAEQENGIGTYLRLGSSQPAGQPFATSSIPCNL